MKKIMQKIKTALEKINKVPLFIVTAGIVISTALFTLSYMLEWRCITKGGLAQSINDIAALRNMTPVLLLVFILIACLADLAKRYIENKDRR